ncbi:hypothetical protein, partial [Streptomyces lasiicapitis]|uniref:hypothetical protein n=1 Tax=Streptomyces lasiicapitis TaxID=1923961 RepID=UPI00366022DA
MKVIRKKVIRKKVAYAVLPLAVVLTVAGVWYSLSGPGEEERYRDKLRSYCDGLIPYEESAAIIGHSTATLTDDGWRPVGVDQFKQCRVGDMTLIVSSVPREVVGDPLGPPDVLSTLRQRETEGNLPIAIGGGWYGYTDMKNTGVVLA